MTTSVFFSRRTLLAAFFVTILSPTFAQQPKSAAPPPLKVTTVSLPDASLLKPYRYQLQAEGGEKPLRWRLRREKLPPGIRLDEFGLLQGTPREAGDFHFTLVVTDSAKAAHEHEQKFDLRVEAPPLAVWNKYPKISGQRIDGSVLVSNGTDHDFDLTFIVVAVNGIGRATALGYQHFMLKKGTLDLDLPFSGTPSRGSYQVNVDVVAKVPSTGKILRTHLATSKNLEIAQGP